MYLILYEAFGNLNIFSACVFHRPVSFPKIPSNQNTFSIISVAFENIASRLNSINC